MEGSLITFLKPYTFTTMNLYNEQSFVIWFQKVTLSHFCLIEKSGLTNLRERAALGNFNSKSSFCVLDNFYSQGNIQS